MFVYNLSTCCLLKTQVQLFSYQCSEHSTSETILEVFSNAREFQMKKEGQNCVSVVVLDEVGLAEDSPSLPLKTLHPLLEDGTTKSNNVRIYYISTIVYSTKIQRRN